MKTRKNISIFICTILFSFLFPNFIFAQLDILVSPTVIQEKAKPRDVLEYKIRIKNLGNKLYHFYTLVEDIEKDKVSDKTNSLAKWVEIFRGRTEISPGQEKEVLLTIKIPSFAQPGSYFTEIIFAQGSVESDARERARALNMPKVLLNIEVEENLLEKLQVKQFKTNKGIFFNSNVKFQIVLENIGTTKIEPQGKIIIYGRKGEEIDNLELEKREILAGETKNYEIFWKAKKNGNLKSVLFGEYGKKNDKIFQDVTFFWVINWQLLVLFSFFFLILIFALSWIFSKSLRKHYLEIFKPKKIFDIFKK